MILGTKVRLGLITRRVDIMPFQAVIDSKQNIEHPKYLKIDFLQ